MRQVLWATFPIVAAVIGLEPLHLDHDGRVVLRKPKGCLLRFDCGSHGRARRHSPGRKVEDDRPDNEDQRGHRQPAKPLRQAFGGGGGKAPP